MRMAASGPFTHHAPVISLLFVLNVLGLTGSINAPRLVSHRGKKVGSQKEQVSTSRYRLIPWLIMTGDRHKRVLVVCASLTGVVLHG